MAQAPSNIGEKLQSLPRPALYAILFILTSLAVLVPMDLPDKPVKPSQDFYNFVNKLPADKPVLISSDWTNSTRGESAGEFKALLRVLMRHNIKMCVFSMADPNAPQVARDTIQEINEERRKAHERPYDRWTDWVNAGFFPNAEAISNAMNNNFKTAFQDKKDVDPTTGSESPIFNSPVLQHVSSLSDFSCLIIVTGSKTSNIAIERVTKTPLVLMVTGVMGPEMNVYYDSGQVKGLVSGLKGLFDVEKLMNEDYKGETNFDNGAKYYPPLHLDLALLVIAVIIGNVGMALAKRSKAK